MKDGSTNPMRVPDHKYLNDPDYRIMVDYMESLIERCQFTPSEIREMAVYAATRYENHRSPLPFLYNPDDLKNHQQ